MYLALRDLCHGKGRFALITVVVALMTLLVGFLSGLTGGLASQNVSALLHLGSDKVVFSMPDDEKPSYTTSRVSEEQAKAWKDAASVDRVDPLGLTFAQVESGDADVAVALLATTTGRIDEVPGDADHITLGKRIADDLGVAAGDTVTLAGRDMTVGELADDTEFSHRDVAWVTTDALHEYLESTRQPQAYANVLLVDGDPEVEALDAAQGTTTQALLPSLLAVEALKSEIGSLGMMIGMLMVIAVLVIGVFFLVWSMQRQRDIAILKALGASNGWLSRDALGQALLVLLIGVGIGTAATVGLGLLARTALPFVMNWITLLVPSVGMVIAGLLGAYVSQLRITSVDPLVALAAAS